MQILNIAGYKFIPLSDISDIRLSLLQQCAARRIKGTILLSAEGININLAGAVDDVDGFRQFLAKNPAFNDITYRESYSDFQPFKRLKVKLKKEIITMRRGEISPFAKVAPRMTPALLKQWLDEKRDFTLLDTRNDFEVRFGTFRDARHLSIADFCQFPSASEGVSDEKPVVTFCTGGIRCEKAALHLLNNGVREVYQLDGGILNYFAQIGGDYYDGECFVFDGRVAVDAALQVTGTQQCVKCRGPMKENQCLCLTNKG